MAETRLYEHCSAIKLEFPDRGGPAPDDTDRTRDFFEATAEDLDLIFSVQAGKDLFAALNQSRKSVTIKMMSDGSPLRMTRAACISPYQTGAISEEDGVNGIVRFYMKRLEAGFGYVVADTLQKAEDDGFGRDRLQVKGDLDRTLTYDKLVAITRRHQLPDKLTALQASLALERWAPWGDGCGSTVLYDPWSRFGAGPHDPRPSDVGLFHELCHCVLYAKGMYAVYLDEAPAVRNVYESVVIGCGPYGPKRMNDPSYRIFTENLYRLEKYPELKLRTAV